MRWLFVFSHPNHEIAVFGLLQRLRPRLVYVTDGGPPERVAATKEGLARIGLQDSAVFLNHVEASLYQALLDRDVAFYRHLAKEVAAVVAEVKPDCVAADAVEFYNPVHDMSLPVAQVALQIARTPATLYELPLIREGSGGDFCLQSPLVADKETLVLTDTEWNRKWTTWTEVHSGQLASLSPLIAAAGRARLEQESFHRARDPLRRPQPAECLRYEARGQLLAERGEVGKTITLDRHVHPVTSALLAS